MISVITDFQAVVNGGYSRGHSRIRPRRNRRLVDSIVRVPIIVFSTLILVKIVK